MTNKPVSDGRFRDIPPSSEPRYLRPPDDAFGPEDERGYVLAEAMDTLVTNRLLERITGGDDAEMTLYGIAPSDQYFAAALASQYRYRKTRFDDEGDGDVVRRMAPFKIGMSFSVDGDHAEELELSITPRAKVFYRRFPTFDEQVENVRMTELGEDEIEMAQGEREVLADGGDQVRTSSLLRVFEGVEMDSEPVVVKATDLRDSSGRWQQLRIELTDRFDSCRDRVASDSRAFREPAEGVSAYEAGQIGEEALENESTFSDWIGSRYREDVIEPEWQASIDINPWVQDDGDIYVEVSLTNTYAESYPADVPTDRTPPEWRSFLYDVGLDVTATKDFVIDRESTEVSDEYRYEGGILADGINCGVNEQVMSDGQILFEADPVPTFRQPKYLSREAVSVAFDDLARLGGHEALHKVAEEMQRAHAQYDDYRETAVDGKSSTAKESYDAMLEDFAQERERFLSGVELIEGDDRVAQAFRLMNQCFSKLGFDHWRLFQIIFIVMNVPDIFAQASDEESMQSNLDQVDVLYFPTGGGKTEAYTGLVIFAAFYDRLRGKHFGTTALTKFPLRLLSLQQLQRIADVMAQAEVIRREEELGGDPFSMGYLVGDRNTPNRLITKSENRVERVNRDEAYARDLLVLSRCPFCGEESLSVDGLPDELRIVHRCHNTNCSEVIHQGGDSAVLPIHITDDEVFRYAPTFVVSTIDKIAIVGMQRRFRTVFGRIHNRCPRHGYTGESGCLATGYNYPPGVGCDETDLQPAGPVDPPSIIIQDELHLLREEFGTFDSHYETFLQEWVDATNDDGWDMKYVAATATIEGAEEQVRSLYWKDANVFPSDGPRLRQSFYAFEHPTRLGRRMLGVMPRTVSRTYAMDHLLKERARVVQELQADIDGFKDELLARIESTPHLVLGRQELSPGELEDLLLRYEIQVCYNIAKRTGDLMQRTIQTMVNRQLEARGEPYHALNTVTMTGETEMNQVRNILSRLETAEDDDRVDVVLATSMISHGVDVDRFNFISFYGMPRNTAEYIQSYSRVGRQTPGTVAVIFNPSFARDRSHYTRFRHYHRYQDLLVEATPLERWAEFAIEGTFPGIFSAIILQIYDEQLEGEQPKRVYLYEGLVQAIQDKKIRYEDMREMVRRSYAVTEDQSQLWSDRAGLVTYKRKIDKLFELHWDRIQESLVDPNKAFLSYLIDRDESHRGPMRSLRDIDEQVPIYPEFDSAELINMLSRGD